MSLRKIDLYLFKNSCRNISAELDYIQTTKGIKLPDYSVQVIQSELSAMLKVIARGEAHD